MAYRIALLGGGSGGHVYPLVAVAQELQKQSVERGVSLELQFWGEGSFLEREAKNIGISYKNIQASKWRRYFSIYNFIDLLKIPIGFIQSLFYVWLFMPDAVFVKGGYASVIPAIVSKIFMVPIFVHESDAIPGKSNLLVSRLARKIFISFESSGAYFNPAKTLITGNPVRSEITGMSKEEALNFFGFSSSRPTVFIIGGSQGAQIINKIIIEGLLGLLKDFNVIHQVGEKNLGFIKSQTENIIKEGERSSMDYEGLVKNFYKFFSVLNVEEINYAYSASDVVVTRAGAGSLFEISMLGKPVIIIPILNSASNHQFANAEELKKYGATVIEEPNLTTHILSDQIKETYKNRDGISQRIYQFANPNAAKMIASELFS